NAGSTHLARSATRFEADYSAAYWWQVIRRPIAFDRAFAGCEDAHPGAVYLDVGPSGNMATYARYNLPAGEHYRVLPLVTPFGRDFDNIQRAQDIMPQLVRSPR